jgi:GPI mannosyltransferase 1 subunit M
MSCIAFGAPALFGFTALGGASYVLYGDDFLDEAFRYHASRRDPRHNFAPHFLFTYLDTARIAAAGDPAVPAAVPMWADAALGSTVCMAASLVTVAKNLPEDIAASWVVSTMVFVALNKVSTAQYFVWYMGLIPLMLPELWLRWGWSQTAASIAWVCSQLAWLAIAYQLEFKVRAQSRNGEGMHFCSCGVAQLIPDVKAW